MSTSLYKLGISECQKIADAFPFELGAEKKTELKSKAYHEILRTPK